jgi:hypothetical protein
MNMKRGLVLSLVALAGMATSAMAQNVQLSLNLRYTDPADPSEGGRWFLVAKTDDPDGLAGVSAYISNINATGIALGNPTAVGIGTAAYPVVSSTATGSIANGGNPYVGTFGGVVNVVWGQDISATGSITPNVGRPGGPGNIATDPLRNPAWNDAALLLSGTFGATRPAFAPSGTNVTDANTLAGTTLGQAGQDANTTFVVRGDSLASLGLNNPTTAGLRAGDANRNGTVTSDDFNLLALNFGGTAGGNRTWDQGDFNDSGHINSDDFNLLALNFGQPAPPAPAVSAIPEPGSLALLAVGVLGMYTLRRRS